MNAVGRRCTKAVAIKTPVPKWLTKNKNEGGMRRRENRVASIGNAQAMVDVARMMNRAATCKGRSYASPRTPPPVAHFDLLICVRRWGSRDCSMMSFCLNSKYVFSLVDEMNTEPQRTEKSHNVQLLIVWYGETMLFEASFWSAFGLTLDGARCPAITINNRSHHQEKCSYLTMSGTSRVPSGGSSPPPAPSMEEHPST